MADEQSQEQHVEPIQVDEEARKIIIHHLEISDPEVYEFVAEYEPTDRAEKLLSAVRIGARGLRAMKSADDVAYVQKEFKVLSVSMDSCLQDVKKQIDEAIVSRLDPDKQGSFSAKLIEMVENTQSELSQQLNTTKEKLEQQFDPTREESYTHQVKKAIDDLSGEVDRVFDPSSHDSHVGKFLAEIDEYLGDDGKLADVLDDKLSLDQDDAPLAKLKREILQSVQDVRDEITGQTKLREKGTQKGALFEGVVKQKLEELAQPHSALVTDVSQEAVGGSKAGDFLIELANGHRLVVEARSHENISTPSAREDLERAMKTRDAQWGILVSENPDALSKNVGAFQVFDNSKLICAYGNGTGDILEVAFKWVRCGALSQQAAEAEVDPNLIRRHTDAINKAVKRFRDIRSQTTTIDKARKQIVNLADEIEKEIEEATKSIEEQILAATQEEA